MFFQFNLMLLHIKVVFSCFEYQILQGFTNNTFGKKRSSFPHIHIQMFFFFLNQLIANWEIFPICNSLLICNNVKETNYQNDKQKHSISIATLIYAMLLSKPSGHQIDKWINIVGFQDSVTNQLLNNV